MKGSEERALSAKCQNLSLDCHGFIHAASPSHGLGSIQFRVAPDKENLLEGSRLMTNCQ